MNTYAYKYTLTPVQAGRIIPILEQRSRHSDNKIYNNADYIATLLLEGHTPITNTEQHYNHRTYELTAPKRYYGMEFPNEKGRFWEINKTLYNFACYLLEQGAATQEDFQRLIDKENTIEAEKQEQERIAQELEKQAEQAKIDFNKWVKEESYKLIGTELDQLKTTVFNSILEMDCSGNVNALQLFILIDNIENPLAREHLSSWLHNDNRASIKLFEVYTGLKLPSTHKERIAFIATLTKKQYSGTQEFKPRKKHEKKEGENSSNLKTYYKYKRNKDGQFEYVEDLGKEHTYNGWTFYSTKNLIQKNYNITEANTGLKIGTVNKLSEVMSYVKEIVDTEGFDSVVMGNIKAGRRSPICKAELLKDVV